LLAFCRQWKEGLQVMVRKFFLIFISSAITYSVIFATAIPSFSQSTQSFQYVIPRFNSNAGSELIISNLSSVPANPEVTFRGSVQGQFADTSITIAAGSQQRLTAASFALSSFQGSVIVASSTPLSVIATLARTVGFETVAPATGSNDLVVPFSQGTTGDMSVTVFNPDNRQTAVVIVPVATNGLAVGGAQLTVGPLGTLTVDIASLFPRSSSSLQDISHLLIHVPKTILGPDHRVFAQAEMSNFSDPAEGIVIPHADFSEATAVPVSAAALSGTFPFFAQGGDYVTELQFINPGSNGGTVTVTARGLDGNVVPGTAGTSIVVPANGAVRHSIQSIFNLSPGTTVGCIVFQSTTPVVAAEAIASVSQNSFVVLPVGPQPNTNFVFSIRASNPQSLLGLAFLNPGTAPANLTLQDISDNGAAISSTTLTLNPSTETARTLADLLPSASNAGFIYVTSDVPVIATALDGAIDNSILGALPAMSSQPDYPGPTATGSTGSTGSPTPSTGPSGFGSAAPVLTSFGTMPAPVIAGNPGFTTTINGTGFLAGVSALVNSVPVPTTLVSSTVIQVTIPPQDLAVGMILNVTAINPAPTVGPSNSLNLPVVNPVPSVLTISPNTATLELEPNDPPLSLTVTGFGFKQGATINVNGVNIPTTFQSSTSLTGLVPPTSLQLGGTTAVSVVNPDPSAGPSASVPLYVLNLVPVLTSVETDRQLTFDSSRPTQTYPATIIVRGSNFSSASIFEVSTCGAPASTIGAALVSSHEANLPITITCVGQYKVDVRAPQPGGGTSQTLSFNVIAATPATPPAITSFNPPTAPGLNVPFTLTITGTNFEQGALVGFGSAVLTPKSVTSTTIMVDIPGYLINEHGQIPVVVTNPDAGGSSNRALFPVF
jgi:hypothetical protein